MLKFINPDSEGFPQKRKQSQRACDTCRKRKKRCDHLENGQSHRTTLQHPSLQQVQWQEPNAPATVTSNHKSTHAIEEHSGSEMPSHSPTISNRSISVSQSHANQPPGTLHSALSSVAARDLDNEDESRFVGDLNPETIFLAATSPAATTGSAEPGGLGFWLSRKPTGREQSSYCKIPLKQSRSTLIHSQDPLICKLLLPYLEDQCLSLLPKPVDFEGLAGIYFEHVHPIFPALDREAFELMLEETPAKLLLKQAICLAASTNKGAKQFLNLSTDTTLSHREFAERLSLAMRTSLDLGLVRDRLVQIQILAILSLFNQLSDDRHWSAELTGRAVSCVHTTGLHLQTHASRKDHDYVTRLFCCIWALDRLNAAFHGRPVLMHERDLGRDLKSCFNQQEGCFQLFLETVFLLDKVIGLYRPTAGDTSTGRLSEFPSFEELLHDTGSLRVSSHLSATIETLYHAVAMLSCRSQSLSEPERSSASYVRQSLSAARVTSIVGEEFYGQLSLLPVVPYAVSLSLRISYRDLRLSKAPIFRTRARRHLLSNCAILRELGDTFSSATVMVNLAEQTVREMDKVCSSMIGAYQQEATHKPKSSDISFSKEAATDNFSIPSNISVLKAPSCEGAPHMQHTHDFSISGRTETLFPFGYDPNTFDPSIFDNMPDLDIFEHFNPDFDLGAIDAALGDNISPSFPMDIARFEI